MREYTSTRAGTENVHGYVVVRNTWEYENTHTDRRIKMNLWMEVLHSQV